MKNLLLMDTNTMIAICVAFGVLFLVAFYGFIFFFLVPMQNRKRAEAKRAKHERKLDTAKTAAEIEMSKKQQQAAIDIQRATIDLQKAALTPSFCPYCGCKYPAGAAKCPNCGGNLG
jgi:Flp pilus assembly protein TadB